MAHYLTSPLSLGLATIPHGVDGTRATLARMWGLVLQARGSAVVHEVARRAVRGVPGKDYLGEARALFHFVRHQVTYRRDPVAVEALQTPEATLHLAAGDCDDMSVLLASLLHSLGFRAWFVAAGYEPDRYQHVWVRARVGGRALNLDPTEPHPPGWMPPMPFQLEAFE